MSKTYKIPIIYERCETFSVEASSLQEAVRKALKEFLSIPDEKYLDDSFRIDDVVEEYEEPYDVQTAI